MFVLEAMWVFSTATEIGDVTSCQSTHWEFKTSRECVEQIQQNYQDLKELTEQGRILTWSLTHHTTAITNRD